MSAKHNVIARTYSVARDCDGMHYGSAEYRMEEIEKNGDFGDLDFFARILGYVVSFHSEGGTMTITQYDGMPVIEWSNPTEEGFHNETVRFYRA